MGTRKGSAYIVFDTETAPDNGPQAGGPKAEHSLVYDFGYVVWSSKGKKLAEHSYVITDTFSDVSVMKNAYYANKLPQYWEGIRNGLWEPVTLLEARKQFVKDVKDYGVKDLWAYNAKFDKTTLNHSLYVASNGFQKYFMPYGTRLRDVWDYSSCITATQQYCAFVKKHNLFTASGNPKTSAESVYAFLTRNEEYVERHTALEDAKIESAILQAAKKKHCKKRQTIGIGWKDAAKLYKSIADQLEQETAKKVEEETRKETA